MQGLCARKVGFTAALATGFTLLSLDLPCEHNESSAVQIADPSPRHHCLYWPIYPASESSRKERQDFMLSLHTDECSKRQVIPGLQNNT